jgi:uncharacterized protein YjcR
MRRSYATGNIKQKDLATEYGVSFQQISRIVRYDLWHDLSFTPDVRRE